MTSLLHSLPFFRDKTIISCTLVETQGHCNELYRVVTEKANYIVRKLVRTDRDRALEWRIQHLAFKEGIAAEPLYFDRENRLMVSAYLEGEHRTSLDSEALKTLAFTLRRLHHIPIETAPVQLHTDIGGIDKYPKEYVLCHNDLNPYNIIFTENVKLIDWEYAGVNDRYFDLASVCVEFRLSAIMQKTFLDSYFDGQYSLEKLEAYKVVYRALCVEWFDINIQLRNRGY
jgi:aminoglycoside phosphotransferase